MQRSRKEFKLQLVLFVLMIAIFAGGIIYITNPEVYFGPSLFKRLTGLQCLFCGGTRAVESLLAGNIIEALYYNFLVVLMLPIVLGACLLFSYYFFRGKSLAEINIPAHYLWFLLIISVLFTIIRNFVTLPLK